MAPRAVVFDCEGARPTPDEKAFFRDADPWGFILFARHCPSAEHVTALCAELRECVGRDAPILIDQEGGRVARMKAPTFPAHPAPATFGRLWRDDPGAAIEAAHLNAFLLGRLVSDLGVDIDCVPMLDAPQEDANAAVIGDRAIASDPRVIAAIGRAQMEGLIEGGALPVMKHMPGHGRATVDSHYHLPRVGADRETLRAVDFAPFRALRDCPMGMTAHVVFEAIDADRCATMSPTVVREIIRGEIGFDGLLFTDDLKMQALEGALAERPARALAAGCDIALCCNYPFADQVAAAAATPRLSGDALRRADLTLALRRSAADRDDTGDRYRQLAALIAPAAA